MTKFALLVSVALNVYLILRERRQRDLIERLQAVSKRLEAGAEKLNDAKSENEP